MSRTRGQEGYPQFKQLQAGPNDPHEQPPKEHQRPPETPEHKRRTSSSSQEKFREVAKFVNTEYIEGEIDKDKASEGQINGYAIYCLGLFSKLGLTDDELFDMFCTMFENWTEKDFERVDKVVIQLMRNELRWNGCFVSLDNRKMTHNLYLTATSPANVWPVGTIEQQRRRKEGFNPASHYYYQPGSPNPIHPNPTHPTQHQHLQIRPPTSLFQRPFNPVHTKNPFHQPPGQGQFQQAPGQASSGRVQFQHAPGQASQQFQQAPGQASSGRVQFQHAPGQASQQFRQAPVQAPQRAHEQERYQRPYGQHPYQDRSQDRFERQPARNNDQWQEQEERQIRSMKMDLMKLYGNGRQNDYQGRNYDRGERKGYGGYDKSYGGYDKSYGGYGDKSYGGYGDKSYGGYGDKSYGGYSDKSYGGYDDKSYGGYSDKSYGGYGDKREYGDKKSFQKKCYVCGKPGCWSTNHPKSEQIDTFRRWKSSQNYSNDSSTIGTAYHAFLAEHEGTEWDDVREQVDNMKLGDRNSGEAYVTSEALFTEDFSTEYGTIHGTEALQQLADRSVFHATTGIDEYNHATTGIDEYDHDTTVEPDEPDEVFTFEDRYSASSFHGILPDTGAAGVSTAGIGQAMALQNEDPSVSIEEDDEGHQIQFGKGKTKSIGHIVVPTPLGSIKFHVLPTKTPFLFSLTDMDRLEVKLDNLNNKLVQHGRDFPIVRKWGHPWLLLGRQNTSTHLTETIANCHLTETEVRQLHRRFGHPSVRKLHDLLERGGIDDVTKEAIERINKNCHQCQIHGGSPGRFRFSIKDDIDIDFNAEIVVDVMYIDGQPVLHVVDTATAFQAARFLRTVDTKTVWEALRMCWIDAYIGPPERIVHDAGKNFTSIEFKHNAKSMAIDVKQVPVEAHNSVGKVERYHAPLRRAYDVIKEDLALTLALTPNVAPTPKEAILQMAVKAVNDTAGPGSLVPTLLVFGTYPRMSDTSPPTPMIQARADAVKKAMKEVKRIHTERQISDALRMRNGPDVSRTLMLNPNDEVLVWREEGRGQWTGPYRLISIKDHTCTIDMPHGPTEFRSTVVKPYNRDETTEEPPDPNHEDEPDDDRDDDYTPGDQPVQKKRGRGRPPGSKNKPKPAIQQIASDSGTNDSGTTNQKLRGHPPPTIHDSDWPNLDEPDSDEIFLLNEAMLSTKEKQDYELAVQLRQEGKITAAGEPFELADNLEIESLIAGNVFKFVQYNEEEHGKGKAEMFRSRMVREVKNKTTTPYEKSRLVVQGCNDAGKEVILTQAPTIQRMSQRLILALAPSLMSRRNKRRMNIWVRDITQAYVQSNSLLNRFIVVQLPKEIKHLYPPGTVMIVLKPLYGIAEAGLHWWVTYVTHHKEKLNMRTSTYDACLLITKSNLGPEFGIVGMQTDDTIQLSNDAFAEKEDCEMMFKAKPKQKLTVQTPIIFNGCTVNLQDDGSIEMTQKAQGKKLELIRTDNNATDNNATHKRYVEQRARGAYIASICQPEATFELSVAAQNTTDPNKNDVANLNKRIEWQMNHMDRGIKYIALDLGKGGVNGNLKLYVFVDASFANNRDLSSQLGFVIILGTEEVTTVDGKRRVTVRGNLIHWSSTKSKRVTRSVLASEIYGMVAGVDIGFSLMTTINVIASQLDIPRVPLVVLTDSFSLYECIVKLGTTKEKRLMIDIMALRQMYERRELVDVRWIDGASNPADAMTKEASKSNKALQRFIDTNEVVYTTDGWVDR